MSSGAAVFFTVLLIIAVLFAFGYVAANYLEALDEIRQLKEELQGAQAEITRQKTDLQEKEKAIGTLLWERNAAIENSKIEKVRADVYKELLVVVVENNEALQARMTRMEDLGGALRSLQEWLGLDASSGEYLAPAVLAVGLIMAGGLAVSGRLINQHLLPPTTARWNPPAPRDEGQDEVLVRMSREQAARYARWRCGR